VAVNVSPDSQPRRRRRRTPEVAEQEIIAAAEALLRERPFRELTVDEVMRRTELSRPSFYVYFSDRHHLVLRVVEHIGGELFTMADRWFEGEGDGPQLAREATEGIVAVFAEHGPSTRPTASSSTASSTSPRATSSARSPQGASCPSTPRRRPRRSCG
jgi:AcrR family transcriptional regulator